MSLVAWLVAAFAWYLAYKNQGEERWFWTVLAIATMVESFAQRYLDAIKK